MSIAHLFRAKRPIKGSVKDKVSAGKRNFFLNMQQNTFLYIVECKDKNYFYIGTSANPNYREYKHRSGQGAFFIKQHGFKSFKLLALFETRTIAQEAELNLTLLMRKKYKNYVVAGANLGHLE